MLLFILFSFVLCYIVYKVYQWKIWTNSLRTFPSYSVTLGDIFYVIKLVINQGYNRAINKIVGKQSLKIYRNHVKDCGYFIIWFGPLPILLLLDSDNFEIGIKASNLRAKLQNLFFPIISDGIAFHVGKRWKYARKIIEISMKPKLLSSFVSTMSTHCDKLAEKISKETGQWIDLDKHIANSVFMILFDCTLGPSTEADQIEMIERTISDLVKSYFRLVIGRSLNPLLWSNLIWLAYVNRKIGNVYKCRKAIKNIIQKEIDRQMTILKNNDPMCKEDSVDGSGSPLEPQDVRDQNILSQLVRTYIDQLNDNTPLDDKDLRMTIDEIYNEVHNVFFAGTETARSSAQWILACLGCEPTIQQKILDELIDVFGSAEGDWTFDLKSLSRCNYLDWCIREGLRSFPVFAILGRTSTSELRLKDGKLVPKGVEMGCCLFSFHMDDKLYPDYEKYDPDRFSPERVKSIPSNGYVPFSVGARKCPGNQFAYLELKLITAILIKNYHIETYKHYSQIDYTFLLSIKPIEPIMLRFTPRVA